MFTIGALCDLGFTESLPVGTPIEVRFTDEENGRLKIKVKIGGQDRRAFHYEIQRPMSLTQEQLDQWREYICSTE